MKNNSNKAQHEMDSETQRLSRFRGCLLGGASGDALGHPVEFLRIDDIRFKYGVRGIQSYPDDTGGLITDDTQMTLFTAEGLLRASAYLQERKELGDDSRRTVRRFVHSAYLRWNKTQSGIRRVPSETVGLLTVPELFVRRAPGNTCLSALAQTPLGQKALNDSKGCGGVMRVAPVGLLYPPEEAFHLGCETAAITHGHRTGIYSSGFLAMIIALLLEGASLPKAIYSTSRFMMDTVQGDEETLDAVNRALEYAEKSEHSERMLAKVEEGWIAEEALAIGLYCALVAGEDFERGITLAVNHDGDSDSTGSIAGQILGAMLGEEGIPAKFLERLELCALIGSMAEDLFIGYRDDEAWHKQYRKELP